MITITPRALNGHLYSLLQTCLKFTHLAVSKCADIAKPALNHYIAPAAGLAGIEVNQLYAISAYDGNNPPASTFIYGVSKISVAGFAQDKIINIRLYLLHFGIALMRYLVFAMIFIVGRVVFSTVERVAVPMLRTLIVANAYLDKLESGYREYGQGSDSRCTGNSLGGCDNIEPIIKSDISYDTTLNSVEGGKVGAATDNRSDYFATKESWDTADVKGSTSVGALCEFRSVKRSMHIADVKERETLKLEGGFSMKSLESDKFLGYSTSSPKIFQGASSVTSFWSPPPPAKPIAIVAPKPRRRRGGRRNHKKSVLGASKSESMPL